VPVDWLVTEPLTAIVPSAVIALLLVIEAAYSVAPLS